jgi:hypothetical protein
MREAILGFVLGFILSARPVPCAQEHAPTVDVCQADRAAWDDIADRTDYYSQETKHLSDGTRNTNPVMKLSLKELTLRMTEMGTCESVDKSNMHAYFELLEFYDKVTYDRYRRFIVRHHLMGQFTAEDAAGVR